MLTNKIQPLRECSLFENLAPYNLFVLANVVEIKEFAFGQILIK